MSNLQDFNNLALAYEDGEVVEVQKVILADISTRICHHHMHKSDKTSKNGVWCLALTSPRLTLDDLVYFCEFAQIFSRRGLVSPAYLI